MCADFEMKAMECIEYYGAKQGITACKDWYDDYIECQSGESQHKKTLTEQEDKYYTIVLGAKQWLRIRAMFKKRHIDNHLEYLQVCVLHLFAFEDKYLYREREPGMRPMRSLQNITPTSSLTMMRSIHTWRRQCQCDEEPCSCDSHP